MSDGLKVTYLSLSPPDSISVVATLGIYVDKMDFYMNKLKLIRKKDGSLYIAYPAEEFVSNKTGNKEFQNYYWFGKKMSERFQIEGFKAIQAFCQTKGIQDPTGAQAYIPKAS